MKMVENKSGTSLRAVVYQYVARMVRLGMYKPGDRIKEPFICEKLNISRTPTREALSQLAGDGLLIYSPQRGFIVRAVDPKEQTDAINVLVTLDAYAARLAAEKLTEEDLTLMHEIIERMEIAAKYRRISDFHELHNRFHSIYMERCENSVLTETMEKLALQSVRTIREDSVKGPLDFDYGAVIDELKTIVSVFKKRDPDQAEAEFEKNRWIKSFLADS